MTDTRGDRPANGPGDSDRSAKRGENAPGRTVCVTGAAGYIGSHLVKLLLKHGYSVHATVRDPSDETRVAPLLSLAASAPQRLKLFGADLLKEGAFDEALAGCDAMFHLASVVRLAARDPQREIVDVNVKGTRNVLISAARAGSVKRVVLTSSVAAIFSEKRRPGHVYTEADWNEDATATGSPYSLSKVEAEKTAWSLHRELAPDARFDLVALHPAFCVGPLLAPLHARSSTFLLRDLLRGKLPLCPRLSISLVDVRDVAFAHLAALENPGFEGRCILFHEARWVREIGRLGKARFPDRPIPTRQAPDLLMYATTLFDKRLTLSFLRRQLGRRDAVDNSKSRDELGVKYRPIGESLEDTFQSMIDLGLA